MGKRSTKGRGEGRDASVERRRGRREGSEKYAKLYSNYCKGLDSSLGVEGESPKQTEDQPAPEEKKRRLDVAA